MPGNLFTEMEEYEGISVMDVYDIVTDFAKEFRPIIEMYGPDPLNNVMSKVVTILEHLEAQTVKIGRLQTNLQEKDAIIARLERDKMEKAADRARFEKELEQIEEHWREESHEMVAVVNRLQEENRKLLKALATKQDTSTGNHSHPLSPEVDVTVLQRSRASIDKLRDQLKLKDREVNAKITEIENLSDQVDRVMGINKELRKKLRISQGQVRNLIDERADFLTQLQDQQHQLSSLRQRLGIAEKENEDLAQSQVDKIDLKNKAVFDLDDPNRPRFTTEELKEILRERNEYKARISELEEELQLYRPKDSTMCTEEEVDVEEYDEDDAPVQGPLPNEPNDAPWRKSESRIRKLFRKLFNETNVNILGSSPKRSLSSFSKMTLASSANTADTSL
ncbi:rab interacting lysosomal protein like isoform X2 [Rhodnius prolixus]|uniref:rab interacting lysosomal protein like isoform X2 n=1 Tax=Rhodnius prolixus TaxID=13249 RepID=UPI003D18A05A